MALFGYAGKTLQVDLSSQRTVDVPTMDYAPGFLGGRGIAARMYWDQVSPKASAFDAENTLVFAVGPLAGIPVLGGSRWTVCGKSPLTSPEHFCYNNLGGRWGATMKFAGYDSIAVQGQADGPVYVFIHDGKAELRDASGLWGKGAIETREMLKAELGSTARVVTIGPAGENMVSTASLLADNDASGSGGLGAVMGSKRLKAIVIKADTRRPNVAHPDRLRELTQYYRGFGKGVFTAWGGDFMVTGPQTKKDPCYGCLGNCLRVMYSAENGSKGKFMCQSGLFYQAWSYRHYGESNEVPFHANRLCDDYGLDTWALEQMIAWLYRCHRSGVLSEESTGLPLSKLGSLEFIETLVRMIAFRQGFGDVLARGMAGAAVAIGDEATTQIRHVDPYEPRLYITTALLWAVEPREPIQELHEVGLPLAQWASWAKKVDGAHVSSDVIRAIGRKFWGSEAAADFSTCEGKALAAKIIQEREYAKECLVLCDWVFPIMESRNTDDHVGDPTLESKILSAVTGEDVGEEALYRIGERVFNLQRSILLREGHRGRADDRIPEEWHTSPLKRGAMDPECLVPGKDGAVISRIGAVVDRADFERMKDEFYELRGWDRSTGLQRRHTLQGMGLKDVADDLEARGMLAPEAN
jgi:aldehyde:ferredoxin oxidoreductase